MEFQFGKFKGQSISDPGVETHYLRWILERLVKDVADIQSEIARRELVEAGDLTPAHRMVIAGYRALAKENRGDEDAMRELEGTRAALEGVLEEYFEEQQKLEETRSAGASQEAKTARNRAYAMEILKDKRADPDDLQWARAILGSQ